MNEWHYHTSQEQDKTLVERLKHFPREPDLLVYSLRSLASLTLRGLMRIYNRFEIVGRENLPLDESFVMVANHSSHMDAPCLLNALPLRKVHHAFSVAAADYFFESIPRVAIATIIVNALPFSRQNHVRQSMELCRQVLATPGNILIIFPAGTRSTTGEIGNFKAGVGALVAGTNIPVVPCFLKGAFEAWPKGSRIPKPKRVKLIVGKPRVFEQFGSGKSALQQIADELQQAVEDLRASA